MLHKIGVWSAKDFFYYVYLAAALCACAWLLTATIGCVPVVFGVKSYESTQQGTKIDFITGFDVGAQANGIDTVNDNRGIKPAGK